MVRFHPAPPNEPLMTVRTILTVFCYNYYMPRNRAVAVVIHNNKLLVMFRKNSREFYTFPGGGIEPGETNEQAAVREIMEEASLTIEVRKLTYEIHHDNGDFHDFFLCSYIDGTPSVQPGTNEYADNALGQNVHVPMWLSIDKIADTTLYPLEIRDQLMSDIKNGFADEVKQFNLKAMA